MISFYRAASNLPYLNVKGEYTTSTHDSSQKEPTTVDSSSAPTKMKSGEPAAISVPTTNVASQESDPRIMRTLLTGLPSPSSIQWSLVTIAMNLILALMAFDLVLRAPLCYTSNDLSFSRVGYVSDKTANILVREPLSSQLPLSLSYRERPDPSSDWNDGTKKYRWKEVETIYYLSNETDFTHSFTLSKLNPSTAYQYSTSSGHEGNFLTAAPVGKFQPGQDKFTFLTTSCIKPRFPYNPLDHPLRIPGMEFVSKLATQLRASFMLFLGDFIYIDVPRRLGWSLHTYRSEYRRVYASPSWPAATRNIPWIHVIDDHEIANDWDKGLEPPYPAAYDPFEIYHHSVNPPLALPNATYYSFRQGPASFFMIDTRRYRMAEFDLPPTHAEKSMLGQKQLNALLDWLKRPEPTGVHWKILVSSIPFTRNWRVNAVDTWSGYLFERQIILEAMWDAASSPSGMGVVVLSGDRHEFAATAFPAPAGHRWREDISVHEFSCSPLSMFYLPVRTYKEVEGESSGVGLGGEDRCLKYLPDGNSKIGAVEITNLVGGDQSTLKYRLFVDGVETWSHVLTTAEGKGKSRDAIWG